MSDIRSVEEEFIGGVDVEERGNSLRVATNTPHLISLGCGRLSTAVTIHPLRQGGVTLGSDPSSNIILPGTGVHNEHCKIENSNGVVTLYPIVGDTFIDGIKVETPTRLSQGCMIGIGRSNYLRFNHPAEANLMKSVLPNTRISMAPIQFLSNDNNYTASQHQNNVQFNQNYNTKDATNQAAALENELEMLNKDQIGRRKPPVAPRRMFRDLDQTSNSSSSDQEVLQRSETPPKTGSIMSKVSKFEYYVKNSQRNVKSPQSNDVWSPKVFSANSLTVNTPAKDVLNGKNVPSSYVTDNTPNSQKSVILNRNNAVEARNCSYTNVTVKNQLGKVDQYTKTFDGHRNTPTSIQLNQAQPNGQINKSNYKFQAPSPSFDRNPVFCNSPTYSENNEMSHSQNYQNFVDPYRKHFDDQSQRSLEQARIDEILNMCAEYEKQNSTGVPTTPTEKKTHNKIITNGSLPRGFQNNPNIIQSSDGFFRFDTTYNRPDALSNRIPNSPDGVKSANVWMNYENAKAFSQSNGNNSPSHNNSNNIKHQQQIPSHHLNFENVQPEVQMVTAYKQENFVQNVRQFPITELSSPVMIRKIARNAQNSSNYVGSYDSDRTKMFFSPYENVSPGTHGFTINGGNSINYTPKSPGSNSPRTRIKTTYAHRNPSQPQHFVFPSPTTNVPNNERHYDVSKCPGIEKQLSLTEDIPMIDDTNFANELEMRIARLNPENREKPPESPDKFILDPLENIYDGHRRNFEEIRRDLIADIPELDAIQMDLDRNISKSSASYMNSINSNSENLKDLSETLKDIQFEDEVFENIRNSTPNVSVIFENNSNNPIRSYELLNDDVEYSKNPPHAIEAVAEIINVEPEDTYNVNNDIVITKMDLMESNLIEENLCQSISIETNDNFEYVNNDIYDHKEEQKNEASKEACSEINHTNSVNNSESQNEKLCQLEHLYSLRKKTMNDMKDIKTEIHDFELSRKQSQAELDEFEIRMEALQDEIEVQRVLRNDEIEVATVSEAEKIKFKIAQEERQVEMKDMQKKLESAEEEVKRVEKDFTKAQATLEELRHAQEMLENERKLFEDMEFQHLEKESEFFSRLSKEQNVVQNDPWGTSKKINKLEKLIQELKIYDVSENYSKERNDAENPIIKKLLNNLTKLEDNLSNVNKQINDIKRDVGIFRNVDKRNDIENYKARIRSGDFSPPTSDEDDMNEIKDRVRSSIDQMSMSMIVVRQTNVDDLCNERSPTSSETKYPIDQMSLSMITETRNMYENNSSTSYRNSLDSQKVEEYQGNEKRGFWERNFDSLSRLKNKDKKAKNSKSQDLMSQSLNENMFYNNDNIESEYGSFEKFNSLSNKKNKDETKLKSENSSKSKISSLTNLSKIIRKDSTGKKNKDDASKIISDNKENVDINVEVNDVHDDRSKDNDTKNSKHRYLKNSKSNCTENKYTYKSSKIQNNVNTNNVTEEKFKDNLFNGSTDENRYSFADSLEDDNYRVIDPSGNTVRMCEAKNKITYRKSDGDEIRKYLDQSKTICDNTKIPSQDDIDRISKVTLDAPLLFSSGEMNNTLGRKTLDSLRELERNRVAMLEEKGCQVIENEREKISELKRRVQSETMQKWEENQIKQKLSISDCENSPNGETEQFNSSTNSNSDNAFKSYAEKTLNDDSSDSRFENSGVENSTFDTSLIEKQLRHSQSDSHNSSLFTEDERSASRNERQSSPLSSYPMVPLGHVTNNTARPLSEMSDMSSENGASPQLVEAPRRSRKVSSNSLNSSFGWGHNRGDLQRPLTRYLPIDNDDLNLRQHIDSAGHQVDQCPHVSIDSTSCRGYLHKLGAKFHGWSKRWFVFDRSAKTLIYYSDKNEKKPRGGAYFQVIEEVYLDHLNASKSPTPLATFVIKTRQRRYYLMAPSGPAARIWIDVIFTGAQGYTEYMQ
ncbi:uncharacterized protein LOC143909520 [Arctopsyche grandis]|uniref:uncharacterized protein LOC143909520 n=1 Tax=Arctopsyche grandis TaxID=121162 RepID=UPI00406D71D8